MACFKIFLKYAFIFSLLSVNHFDLQAAVIADANIDVALMRPAKMVGWVFSQDETCTICQEELGNNPANPVIALLCSPSSRELSGKFHSFHANCIKSFWESIGKHGDGIACPICRKASLGGCDALLRTHRNDLLSDLKAATLQLCFLFVSVYFLYILNSIEIDLSPTSECLSSERAARVVRKYHSPEKFCIAEAKAGPELFNMALIICVFVASTRVVRKTTVFLKDIVEYFRRNPRMSQIFEHGGVIRFKN